MKGDRAEDTKKKEYADQREGRWSSAALGQVRPGQAQVFCDESKHGLV